MTEDSALLRRYAELGSETAFAELVQRRIGLVYSVALRQTYGDAHRAHDVTQAVFTDLARKARTLVGRPVLAGWLCRSAHFAAFDLMRSVRRRAVREQEAHTMHELTNPEAGDETWQEARPLLDRMLSEMDERDRDAIVLRFFDGRPFGEVGAGLRLTENAARMRVERALDKLRLMLARQGVKSTSAALSIALANQAGASVPVGMAATVTSGALAAGGGFVGAGLGALLAASKLPMGIAAALMVAGTIWWTAEQRTQAALRREIAFQHERSETIARLRRENEGLVRTAEEVNGLRSIKTQLARLNAEEQVLQRRIAAATGSRNDGSGRAPPPLAPLTVPVGDELVTIRLPDADQQTAFTALEIYLQTKIVRDPSIQRNRGLVRVIADRIPKREAVELIRTALRDSAGIVVEPSPDGRLTAKAWTRP